MISDPVTSQEQPEPPAAPGAETIKDQRAVEAAVAGVAGLLLGRALFGSAGGLAAGLAAVGAGLLAKRLQSGANGRQVNGGVPVPGENGLQPQSADAVGIVARFEAPVAGGDSLRAAASLLPSAFEGGTMVFTAKVNRVAPEGGRLVDSIDSQNVGSAFCGVVELGDVDGARLVAEMMQGGLASGEKVLDCENVGAGFSVELTGAGDIPAVPAIFELPAEPNSEAAPVQVPRSIEGDGDIALPGVVVAEGGVSAFVESVSPQAGGGSLVVAEVPEPQAEVPVSAVEVVAPLAEMVDLAALVAAPLEEDGLPLAQAAKAGPVRPLLADELPPAYLQAEAEPDPGPRDEFLVIPESPVVFPPPLEPVVAALSVAHPLSEAESLSTVAPVAAEVPKLESTESTLDDLDRALSIDGVSVVQVSEEKLDPEAESAHRSISAPVLPVFTPAAELPVAEVQRPELPVESSSEKSITAEAVPSTAPAPVPSGKPFSPFRLWTPESVPAAAVEKPLLFPAAQAPEAPREATSPVKFISPARSGALPDGPVRPEPLAFPAPPALPVAPSQGQPDPEEIWRQAAAELVSLKTAAVPVRPAPLPPGEAPVAAFPSLPPAAAAKAPLPDWLKEPASSAPLPPPPALPSAETAPVGEAKSFLRTIRLEAPGSNAGGAWRSSPIKPPPGLDPALAGPALASAPVLAAPVIAPLSPQAAIPPPVQPVPVQLTPVPAVQDAASVKPAAAVILPPPQSSPSPLPAEGLTSSALTAKAAPLSETAAASAAEGKVFVPSRKSSRGQAVKTYRKPLITPLRLILLALLAAIGLGVTYRAELKAIWEEKIIGRSKPVPPRPVPQIKPKVAVPGDGSDVIIKPDPPRPSSPPAPLVLSGEPLPVPPPAAPPVEAVPAAPAAPAGPLPVNENGARELIGRLFRATSSSEIRGLIHDSARLVPLIDAYFSEGRSTPVSVFDVSLESAGRHPATGRTVWQLQVTTDSLPKGFSLSVEETPDGLRTDWEQFTQCRDQHLTAWVSNAAAAPAVLYTALKRAHIFPDMLPDSERRNYLAFDLAAPVKEAPAVKAYIHKSSPLFSRAENLYLWDKDYGSVLELTHKEGRIFITGIVRENWRPIPQKQR